MKAFNEDPVMVQKYPVFRKLDPEQPPANNLKEVYNYKRDGNYKGLLRHLNFSTVKEKMRLEPVVEKLDLEEMGVSVPNQTGRNLTPGVKNSPQKQMTYKVINKTYYTYGDLIRMNAKSIPYLIENLLPAGAITILGGESQVGKSILYQQLTVAIIHGDEKFLGFNVHSIHRRVLIVNTEDDEVALSANIIKLTSMRNFDSSLEDKLILFPDGFKLLETIEAKMNELQFDLVVIDPLTDVLPGDMNQSNVTRQFLNKFHMLAKKHKCAFLIVHHTGKAKDLKNPNKAQLLGSVGIEGKARQVLMLSIYKDNPDIKIISIVKGNYLSETDKNKKIYLKFDPQTLISKEIDYEPKKRIESTLASGSVSSRKSKPGRQKDMKLYNLAIKLHKEGMKQIEIAKKVGRDKSTVCKWIKASKINGYDFSKVEEDDY